MPEISRRTFGGLVGGGAVTAVAAAGTTPAAAAPAERPFQARTAGQHGRRRPNLLVILGDDLGWADLSAYGAPHIKTPHLDRLARQGVRFTDSYSGSATCSPTRFRSVPESLGPVARIPRGFRSVDTFLTPLSSPWHRP